MPGGKLCVVSMTFSASAISRAVSKVWTTLWRLNPGIVGGYHPIELKDFVHTKQWKVDQESNVTSFGITSEVLVASR
jgi:hypothetical protein